MVVNGRSQLPINEKILKSIFSALHYTYRNICYFCEVTQPFERNQKVNKDLTPSGLGKEVKDILLFLMNKHQL